LFRVGVPFLMGSALIVFFPQVLMRGSLPLVFFPCVLFQSGLFYVFCHEKPNRPSLLFFHSDSIDLPPSCASLQDG